MVLPRTEHIQCNLNYSLMDLGESEVVNKLLAMFSFCPHKNENKTGTIAAIAACGRVWNKE